MILELKPDIVISDNQMPKINGVEVVKKIFESNIANPPKFIMVTADAGFAFNRKCREIGISYVIHKENREYELEYILEVLIDIIKTSKSL